MGSRAPSLRCHPQPRPCRGPPCPTGARLRLPRPNRSRWAQDAPSRVAWEESGPTAPLRTERLWGRGGVRDWPPRGGFTQRRRSGECGVLPWTPTRPSAVHPAGVQRGTDSDNAWATCSPAPGPHRRVGVAASSRHVHPLGPPPAAGKPPRARAVRGGRWTGHFRRSAESSWARGAVLDLREKGALRPGASAPGAEQRGPRAAPALPLASAFVCHRSHPSGSAINRTRHRLFGLKFDKLNCRKLNKM